MLQIWMNHAHSGHRGRDWEHLSLQFFERAPQVPSSPAFFRRGNHFGQHGRSDRRDVLAINVLVKT